MSTTRRALPTLSVGLIATTAGAHRVRWDTSDVDDVEPGRFRIALDVAGRELERTGVLEPPRAFPTGQIPGPPGER